MWRTNPMPDYDEATAKALRRMKRKCGELIRNTPKNAGMALGRVQGLTMAMDYIADAYAQAELTRVRAA
jgi:hypothetical protein